MTDLYVHSSGQGRDEVLSEFTRRLREAMRSSVCAGFVVGVHCADESCDHEIEAGT